MFGVIALEHLERHFTGSYATVNDIVWKPHLIDFLQMRRQMRGVTGEPALEEQVTIDFCNCL
jgi:hypothetical protein